MSYASAVPAEEVAGAAFDSPAGPERTAAWQLLVEVLAAVQVALAVVAVALALPRSDLRLALWALTLLAFAVAAAILLAAAREPRARSLGVFYLLAAAGFAIPIVSALDGLPPLVGGPATLLRHIRVDSFSAYFFWLFFLDFPRRRPFERFGALASRLTDAALVVGVVLCALVVLVPLLRVARPWPALFDPERLSSFYWPILFLFMVPALPYAWWRMRRALPDEARRARIMVAGLALGLAPDLLLTVVTPLFPALRAALLTPGGQRIVLLTVNLPLLAVPFVTAYAVLAQHALELRFFVRRAIGYALARSTLGVAAALPLLGGAVLLYARREEPLATLVADGTGTAVLVAAAAAFLMLRLRARFLLQLDRRFFREQYDVRGILNALIERIGQVRSPAELEALLRQQLVAALHIEAVDLLLRDDAAAGYRGSDGRLPPLGESSALLRRLDALGSPLVVDWAWPGAWLRSLPPAEQQWLIDAGHALLVPVRHADGTLPAVLALGDKLSDLPYTRDDRALLGLVANAVALALSGPGMAAVASAEPQAAQECRDCGLLHAGARPGCDRCGGLLAPAPLPLVLAGKFRLLERIGRGAMGVVYRARDLALEREVAIKTLPRTSATEAARLRHEARAMAAVSHPSLAAIYGVESSGGTPLLVVEYLAGGTLSERLRRGPLAAGEALELAEPLARGLARLHDAGILHRDIKPSNIGFTGEGHPKLLDFGIARTMGQMEATAPPSPAPGQAPSPCGSSLAGPAGTPLYLSPEAVRGEPPDPSVDLWALCMVLYEAMAGRHPLEAERSQYMALLRVAEADFPDVRTFDPDVPEPVATLLRAELGRDPARRARSARALAARLEQLRASLLVAA